APASTPRQLTELTLEHFRLPGRRTWKLHPDHTLHVVHGYNGTGKSSLVEALELAATGQVERIALHPTARDHKAAITNRDAPARGLDAWVTVCFDTGVPHVARVLSEGADTALVGKSLPAASFRMHQALGDRLSQTSAAVRGRTLLEAFFPDESQRLDVLDGAQARFSNAVR